MKKPPIQLLLLDDEASLRDPLAKRLRERYGFQVDEAACGVEAKTLLDGKLGQFDVALLDAVLNEGPGGLEILKYIKATYPKIEVIFFTGWGMDNAIDALQAGAFRYLAKPFNFEELVGIIKLAAEYHNLKSAASEKVILEQVMITSTALLSNLDEGAVLNQILDSIHSIGFDRVRLYMVSPDGLFLQGKAHFGMDENFDGIHWLIAEDSYMQIILKNPRPYVFHRDKDASVPFEFMLGKYGVDEWACIPLLLGTRVIGKLSVDRKYHPYPITDDELRPLALFASQAAVAIENARLFRETQQRVSQLETLRKTTLAITSPLDHEITLQTVLQQAVNLLNAKSGGIDEYNSRTEQLTVVAEIGRDKNSVGNILEISQGLAGNLIVTDDAFIIIDDYSHWKGRVESYIDRKYKAVIAVPLIWQEKRIGVLYLDDDLGRKFTSEDARLLSMFADQASIVLVHSNTLFELSTVSNYRDHLVANSFDGIISTDLKGAITGFSPMAERILGYDAGDVLGKPITNFYFDETEAKHIGDLLKTSADHKLIDYETSVRSKEGDRIPILLSSTWILGANGTRIGSAGYFRDLRQIQEVERHRQWLLDASSAVASAENLEDGLQSLAGIMAKACNSTFCAILLLEADQKNMVVEAVHFNSRETSARWEGMVGKVHQSIKQTDANIFMQMDDATIITHQGDEIEQKLLIHLSRVGGFARPLNSAMIVPLLVNKKRLGMCVVGDLAKREGNSYPKQIIELACSLASQTAVLIEKIMLHRLTLRRAEVLDTMQKRALLVSSTLNPSEILEKTCEAAVNLFKVEHSGLVVFNWDYSKGFVAAQYPVRIDSEVADIVVSQVPIEDELINNLQPIVIYDVEHEERLGPLRSFLFDKLNIHSSIFVPVTSKGELLGSFSLDTVGYKRQFTCDEIELCRIFAAHVASAIEKARLYQESNRRTRLLIALEGASRNIRADKEPEKLFQAIAQFSGELMGYGASGLFINYPNLLELELVTAIGLPKDAIRTRIFHKSGFIGEVALTGETKLLQSPFQPGNWDAWLESYGYKTAIGVPLKHAGIVEAVLFVADEDETRYCTPTDLDILERFATQALMALHTSKLMDKEQRRFSQLSILHRISDYIQETRDLQKIYHVVLTGITAGYGLSFNRAILLTLENDGEMLAGRLGIGNFRYIDATRDWSSYHNDGLDDFGRYIKALEDGTLGTTPVNESIQNLFLPVSSDDTDIFSQVVKKQRSLLIEMDDAVFHLPKAFTDAFEPALPLLIVPIVARKKVLGLIIVDNKFTNAPVTAEDIDLLLTFANTAAMAIDNIQLYKEAKVAKEKISSLFKASTALVSSKATQEVMRDILNKTQIAAQADWVSVVLIDELGQSRGLFTTGEDNKVEVKDIVRPNGVTVRVVRTGEFAKYDDTQLEKDILNPRMFLNHVAAALCLPFEVQGKRIGAVWIHYNDRHHFLDYEVEGIQMFVNQAAIAYDSARRIEELEHMRQAVEMLSGIAGLQEILNQIVKSAREVLDADSAAIWSYDENRRKFSLENSVNIGIPSKVWKKLQKNEPRPGGTISTIQSEKWVGVTNIMDTQQFPFLGPITQSLLKEIDVQSFQGISLAVNEENLGILCLNYNRQRLFSETEKEIAITFANHAALALKNAKSINKINCAHNTARVVAKVSALGDLRGTLKLIVSGIQEVMQSSAVILYTYNQDTHEFNFPPEWIGVRQPDQLKVLAYVAGNSVPFRIIDRDEIYFSSDAENDILLQGEFIKREGTKSFVGVQLVASGRKVGVLCINYRQYHNFTNDELTNIELFADQAAIAIENARIFEDMRKIKGYVGNQTAVEWMDLVGKSWGHSIKREVGTSLVSVDLVRKAIQNKKYSSALAELDDIEIRVQAIKDIPITTSLDSQFVSVRVNNVLKGYLSNLWKQPRFSLIQLHLILDPRLDDDVTVRASEAWLRNGIEIIVDNAVYAMTSADSIEKHLTVQSRLTGDVVELLISDTGPGISEEMANTIFKKRVDKIKGSRGSGVGLLVAKNIFEACYGSIWLSETGPQGSTFTIRLPVESTSNSV